jgi:D-aminopeptidase
VLQWEATEEAIVNAMVAAATMTGADGLRHFGLPHDEPRAILQRDGRVAAKPENR